MRQRQGQVSLSTQRISVRIRSLFCHNVRQDTLTAPHSGLLRRCCKSCLLDNSSGEPRSMRTTSRHCSTPFRLLFLPAGFCSAACAGTEDMSGSTTGCTGSTSVSGGHRPPRKAEWSTRARGPKCETVTLCFRSQSKQLGFSEATWYLMHLWNCTLCPWARISPRPKSRNCCQIAVIRCCATCATVSEPFSMLRFKAKSAQKMWSLVMTDPGAPRSIRFEGEGEACHLVLGNHHDAEEPKLVRSRCMTLRMACPEKYRLSMNWTLAAKHSFDTTTGKSSGTLPRKQAGHELEIKWFVKMHVPSQYIDLGIASRNTVWTESFRAKRRPISSNSTMTERCAAVVWKTGSDAVVICGPNRRMTAPKRVSKMGTVTSRRKPFQDCFPMFSRAPKEKRKRCTNPRGFVVATAAHQFERKSSCCKKVTWTLVSFKVIPTGSGTGAFGSGTLCFKTFWRSIWVLKLKEPPCAALRNSCKSMNFDGSSPSRGW